MAFTNRRLLILSYYFPPSHAAGAQRIKNLVDVAMDAGWHIDVMALREGGDAIAKGQPESEIDKAILKVHRLSHIQHLQEKYKGKAADALKLKKPFRAAFWLICNKILVPLNRKINIFKFQYKANKLINENQIDVVLSSGPPFILHQAALGVKKKNPDIKWIADFRDPWVYPGSISSLEELPARSIFKKVALSADRISVVTQGYFNFLSALYQTDSIHWQDKLSLAPNGAPMGLYDSSADYQFADKKKINIGYLGDITYTYRNPKSLIQAVSTLVNQGEDLALYFWSNITPYTRWENEGIDDMTRAENIADRIKVNPYVPKEKALSIQKSLDLLVLFALQQPYQIPSKVYEYLVTNRPILAICDENGETHNLLKNFDGVFIATENTPQAVLAVLKSALGYISSHKKDHAPINIKRQNLSDAGFYSGFEKLLNEI